MSEEELENNDWCHYSDLPSPISYMSKEEWVEEPYPIMDDFDKTLKMLHESTHDVKIRESILLVQRYKTEYLDNTKQR
jgi:hypothetical protein